MSMTKWFRRHEWSAVVLIAFFLRLLGISQRPIWYDEAFAILFSQKGIRQMIQGTLTPTGTGAADIHPLLYYSILSGWIRVFGDSVFVLRILSIIFGIGSVYLAYSLAQDLFGSKIGLISGILVALNPFQIHYAQEIRMYSLLTFSLIGATWAFWRAYHQDKWYWWVTFMLFSAIGQYSHNLAVFYLVPLSLSPLITREWRIFKKVIYSGLGAVILYFPWLLTIPSQFQKISTSYWTTRPSISRLVTTLLSFVTNLPLSGIYLIIGLFIAFLVVILALWQTVKFVKQKEIGWKRILWLVYLTFIPVLLLFGFSQWKPVFIDRALLPSGITFLIWLGVVLWGTPLPKIMSYLMTGCLVAAFFIGIVQHITYAGFPYGPFPQLVNYLNTHVSSDGIILHSNKLTLFPCVYYDPTLREEYIADPNGSGSDTLAPATQQVLGWIASDSMEKAIGTSPEVTFVIFSNAIKEYQDAGFTTHPQIQWMDQYYRMVEIRQFDDILVYRYVRR